MNTICYYHGSRFERKFAYCCDPLNKHKKHKTKGQALITVNMALKLQEKSISITPGWKLSKRALYGP